MRLSLPTLALLVATTSLAGTQRAAQAPRSGNPILTGWYADPEARIFEHEYWIYPTYSAPYGEQTFLDAFSSPDLITWTKHPRVVDTTRVTWATRAVWAPSIVEKSGGYYLFFGANDIQNDSQVGGIGVARASHPGGPFEDHLGHPLVDAFHNGAQPIDPFVFKDEDGTYYLIYGGWRHCNIAKLNADFTGFLPFPDGATFKEITPSGYVEGSFMFVKDGKYYFMWSEGGWTGPNYAVAYAIGSSPLGPFTRAGKILSQDPAVATGAGHHSILHAPGSPTWYIVYHRRPLGETDRNHRVVCIDEMRFDASGAILPVAITTDGVARDPLVRGAVPLPAQVPALPRVYVHTDASGDPGELRERQQSVKDVRAALLKKKKDLVVVDEDEKERADFDVEIVERTSVVPRIRIGISPPGAVGPARVVRLRVKLTHGETTEQFTNKNTAYDVLNGWSSAADDVARQIDQWIVLHKGRLELGRT